jgi:putative ABC transport system ATP-binding protein
MTELVLSCRGVVHDYDGSPAVAGVDLDVYEGEVVAITGPSGSGKSTLLLCLAGIIVPREGSVLLGGVDLRAVGERNRAALRRESVGVVFQYGTLVPELTGEENVALPLLLSGRSRAEALKTAAKWLERLGVASVARVTAGRMSGGQRQRVALARALVDAPRVVLADEPTGALDSVASDLVAGELVSAARDAGAAVVLVTHDARVAAFADREVHLWDGRVDDAAPSVESVTDEEVLR